jgi:hypothetical protein
MSERITDAQAALQRVTAEQAADIAQRLAAFERWRGNRQSYRPEEIPADVPSVSNDERSALERFRIWRDKPRELFAYYRFRQSGALYLQHFGRADFKRGQPTRGYAVEITTWTGEHLAFGRTTSRETWQSNLGDYRASVEVTAENGARYVGTLFLSAGDYCRLRLKAGS